MCVCVCPHVHLDTPEPPWRAPEALPDWFLLWVLIPGSFIQGIKQLYSVPGVGHMAKPFRREGLRSQPALEDAARFHTQGCPRAAGAGECPQGTRMGWRLHHRPGVPAQVQRPAEQRPLQPLDSEGEVGLLPHLPRTDLPAGGTSLSTRL